VIVYLLTPILTARKLVLSTDVIFEPIDALKPFKIDGKVYENVKVTNSKKK
jgi:hypothetical protein